MSELDRRVDELPRLMREMGSQLLSSIAALDGRLPETVRSLPLGRYWPLPSVIVIGLVPSHHF